VPDSAVDHIQWIGYLAGLLTALAYIPQLKKVWVTKSADDISLRMMLVLSLGLALWIVFGLFRGEIPIVVANAVSLTLALGIVAIKLKYG
jgi:MtN3 and saliva related transmembrane protein